MEIKHLIFIIALIGIIPLAYFLMLSQRFTKICVFLIPFVLTQYEQTAINFLSNPVFKGSARGYEISLIHIIAVALLLSMILRRWPVKFFFPGVIHYSIFFFICLLSMTASPNKVYSGFEIMKMITFFFVFLAVANYFYITHDFDSFLNGLAIVVAISFFLSFKMKYFEGRVQTPGIFHHQNSAGMFMCLVGPLFLSRLLNKKEYLFKTFFYLSAFLMSFLSALFTYSRGTLACFPLGCFIVIFFSLAFHFTLKTLIVIFVTSLLGIAAIGYSAPNIYKRFTQASGGSAEMRMILKNTAMNIIRDKPLLGCGVNNWGIVAAYPQYNPYRANDTHGRFRKGDFCGPVETIYFLVGAECGLLGLGALLLWYFYYLYQAVYQAYRWRKTDFFYLLAGLEGGLGSNYLQSTLEWCLKQQINFCILFCCFGIIAVLIQGSHEHTTLSYLELLALRREEQRKQLQMAAEEAQQDQLNEEQQSQMLEQ